MIHIKTFGANSEFACIDKINAEIPDEKIINVIPSGPVMRSGYESDDEGYPYADTYYSYYMKVIYRD